MADDERLRFAVAMRGGVSLAVWIGGALHEIRSLSSETSTSTGVLGLTRFAAVDVDVLTGASAGGLNAALAGLE
jgi:predicted acylesterase/phospholipase RssA